MRFFDKVDCTVSDIIIDCFHALLGQRSVITSYSIHYTKLYDDQPEGDQHIGQLLPHRLHHLVVDHRFGKAEADCAQPLMVVEQGQAEIDELLAP